MTTSRHWSRRDVLALGALASAATVAGCTPGQSASPVKATSPDDLASPKSAPTGAASPVATPAESTRVGPAGPAHEIARGSSTTSAVALTFHGAGDPTIATAVLREIERAHGLATVFAVGSWLQSNSSIGRRILDGGHVLGNHTMNHKPMRRLTAAAAFDEIARGAAIVHQLSGSTGWFRPSGTPHATPTILAAAGKVGYHTSIAYDVDPADYTDPGQRAVTSRVLGGVRPGSIVSLHLGHTGTLAAMPAILEGLAARNLAAVTVTTLLDGVRA